MIAATDTFTLTAGVLAVAAVVGFIASRAKQPLIVAFIAVGILVGPSGFGWVRDTEPLELFAEIGIAILLFLVGLKLDVHLVRTTGRVALITGIGQVLFTSLVGFLLAVLLGMDPMVALFVAIALTFSSTIIIVKLLSDKRELEELHGRIALGFLIVQDIVVVLVMISLSSFGGDRDGSIAAQFALVAVQAAALLVGLAIVMRWVLPAAMRYVATSSELLVVTSVAWAVSIAALSSWLDFSVEVGAFLAGFALASTPYRESLASSLSGLRDFLLLFFFIELGAQLDFSAISSQIPAAIVLSLFVLIGNPLIVMVIMGIMRYPKRVSFLCGLAVAQISEFSLILIALGRDLDYVDNEAVGLVTLVGMITIGTSTYLILYSHQIYDRIAPLLSVFERERTLELPEAQPVHVDVIVYGYGRFGRHLVDRLLEDGRGVLIVDWDPRRQLSAVAAAHTDQVSIRYGDADDAEYPASLPLAATTWVVSTIPRVEPNKVLASALRSWGYSGQVALTAHTDEDAALFTDQVSSGVVDIVVQPFDDAADDALHRLFPRDDGAARLI